MLFNTPVFLFLFLPVAFLWHWTTIGTLRNSVLLALSLLFYWWGGSAVIYILLGSIIFNWLCGLLIGVSRSSLRIWVTTIGVFLNLLVLAYYKYANGLIFPSLGLNGWIIPNFVIPLGISFYTFHSISYLVDVCRLVKKPFQNPINFGLYISLFPQLVAGPIVRFHDIADQIEARHFNLDQISSGCERFIFGLSKKVLLADSFAPLTDHVFGLSRGDLSTSAAWVGIVSFSLQIYYDFSGYSDMAIGLGRMFGFELLENFNYPYFADSITDFWHRWHLSLSAWFRDYLYIPLGGNRISPLNTYRNLLTVFVLCGLWHGASFNFVIWGLYNGVFLIIERLIDLKRWLPQVAQHAYALLVVMIGWVFFRCHSFHDARQYCEVLSGLRGSPSAFANGLGLHMGVKVIILALTAMILAIPTFSFMATDFRQRRFPTKASRLDQLPSFLTVFVGAHPILVSLCRMAICLALFLMCIVEMTASTSHSFIYFNF